VGSEMCIRDRYYERRDKEWAYRRTELKSLGISRGPDIKWMAQLIAGYHWDNKLLGPVQAKARLGGLFEGRPYDLVKRTKPELAYQLYLLGQLLESSVKELARSKQAFAWQALFTLFSLCVKALQVARVDFGQSEATIFFEDANLNRKWVKLCQLGVNYIQDIYRIDARAQLDKTGDVLTLTNYFKAYNYIEKILRQPLPHQVKSLAGRLAHAG